LKIFSGIEGGATKTVCVVGSETGQLLGVGYGGSSNYLTAGIAKMKESLADSLQIALQTGGVQGPPETVYAGLAGVGLLDPQREARLALQEATRTKKVLVNSDGYVALYGSFVGKAGMIVISGTGSIAMGFNERGKFARVGGWGYLLGDEGSAFHVGLEGVRAVVKSHDGSLPLTSLAERALSFFHIQRIEELVKVFYLEDLRKEKVAAFSAEVVEAASKGDTVAASIINSECVALKTIVKALQENLSLKTPRLALSGGVFEGSEWFRKRFVEELGSDFEIAKPLHRAVTGAFMLALTSSGIELTPRILENITQSESILWTQTEK